VSRIPNVTRKQGIYYYRRLIRLGVQKPFRIRISLRTRCHKRASLLSAALTLFCEQAAMTITSNSETQILTAEQRAAIFRDQLLIERDRLEVLHARLQIAPQDFPDYEGGVERALSLRLSALRMAADEELKHGDVQEFFVAEEDPCLDEDEEQTLYILAWSDLAEAMGIESATNEALARIAKIGVRPTDLSTAMARNVVASARIEAIEEFRRKLVNPSSAFPLVPVAGYEQISYPIAQTVPSDANPVPSSLGPWATMTPTEAVEKFFEHNPRTGGVDGKARRKGSEPWTDKTREQFKLPALLLEQVMDGRPLSTVTHDDLVKLDKCFARLHGRSFRKSPEHRTMTIWQIVEETEARVKLGEEAAAKFAKRKSKSDQPYTAPARSLTKADIGLGLSTTNRHWGNLRQLTEWFEKHHRLNPLDYSAFIENDERDARHQRDGYTEAQGRQLFNLPPWTGSASHSKRMEPGDLLVHSAWYFVPMIAWYTGMRREEICALRLDEIAEVDGHWQFDCRKTENRRLKTVTSARSIPFADELMRLRLPEYVQALRDAGETMLFPELVPESGKGTMGDAYYKMIWMKIATGLPFLKLGQAMHSFRHTATTDMKRAGIPSDVRADLLGHKLSSETEGRYSKVDMELLRKAANAIPKVTSHLDPFPTTLLPERLREPRKSRSVKA